MGALPTDRIFLPDHLAGYDINPKWAQFRPKYLFLASAGYLNLINNEVPTTAGAFPTAVVGKAGRAYYCDDTASNSFDYTREPYNCGSRYTLFVVIECGAAIGTADNIMACGTITGTDKPFNYRLMTDGAAGKQLNPRYYHDTGPSTPTHDFDLSVEMKSQEPSTVSVSINGTELHKCIDGVTGTATLSPAVAPVDAGEGEFSLFGAGGSNATIDASIYLAVVFDEFIPNDVLYDLHLDPSNLFIDPTSPKAVVAAAASTTIPSSLHNIDNQFATIRAARLGGELEQ